MAQGDKIRFRQGSRSSVNTTAKQAGQLLFATYEDELLTTSSSAESFVQGDIYFDLSEDVGNTPGARIKLANDVDKARTLFAGTTSTVDANGQWTADIDGITKLYDGLTIALKLTTSSSTTYNTLNVNGLGPKLVWFKDNYRLTKSIEAGAEVLLTYRVNAGSYTVPANTSGALTPSGTYRDGWIMTYQDGDTIPSAYCTSPGAAVQKTAECTDFVLQPKSYIQLIVKNANTSSGRIQLNINGTGDRVVYINGKVTASNNNTLPAGSYLVYYDGTYYQIRTDGLLPGAGIAGNAATATVAEKLGATDGTILTNLGSNDSQVYTHGGNITPGVTGILGVGNGGTGSGSVSGARSNLGLGNGQIYYGTCSTGASTVAKAVVCDAYPYTGPTLGDMILVKFTTTNSGAVGNLTMSVNGTDAKPIRYIYNGSITSIAGANYLKANQTYLFYYDGTYWVVQMVYNTNTDIRPAAYCDTSGSTAAKVASHTGYSILDDSYIYFTLVSSNTAASALTLKINSKDAKPIYINGEESSASNYTLPAGTYIVYYDGTAYHFRTDGQLPGHVGANTITGIVPVTHGGTGVGSLASGKALIGNGTGNVATRDITNLTTASSALTANTNLITANTLVNYAGSTNQNTVGTITTGTWNGSTIAIAHGGTGMTSNPSLLVNLASGNADSVFKASPRPGVTGLLPVGHGGTGTGSFTAGHVLIGNGSGAIQTNGNLQFDSDTDTLMTKHISTTGDIDITGNAYLRNQTYADDITASTLLVQGSSNFIVSPTAPTPTAGDSSSKLATTEFVTNAAIDTSRITGILPVTHGGTGLGALDSGKVLIGNGNSDVTFRSIFTRTAVGNLGWTSGANALIDQSGLAYWDGAYSGTNSNLKYLGTVTKGTWQASTIGVAYGGTGITSNPSMLINLESGSADTVFKASPRPGVTGILPVEHGGTGLGNLPDGALLQGNGLADMSAASAAGSATLPIYIDEDGIPQTITSYGGTANAATKLTTGHTFITDLGKSSSSNTSTSFDGTQNVHNIPITGTLLVSNGGTGLGNVAANAVLIGKDASALQAIATNNGAFYATAANAKPTFGTLPVAQGGTGVTSVANIKAGKDGSGNTITSTYATKTELNNLIAAQDVMVFKGVVNSASDLPNVHDRGWTYRVGTAGTYVGQTCEVGDIIICTTDRASASAQTNGDWQVIQTNIDGAVTGPSGGVSAANAIAAFGSTAGRTLVKAPSAGDSNTPIYINSNGVATAISSYDGNSATASKLKDGATIAISGGITGTATNFDGSAAISIPVTKLDLNATGFTVAGVLPIEHGGTGNGRSSYTANRLIYASSASKLDQTPYMHLNYTAGTTSVIGSEELVIGNNIGNGTANNAQGKLTLYGKGTAWDCLVSAATSTHLTHTMPNSSGWLVTAATAGAGGTYKPIYVSNAGIATAVTDNQAKVALGSDNAASVFAQAPQIGVTGILPIVHGGTGGGSAASARESLEVPHHGVYYVKGTQTAATATWTGDLPEVAALYDGLTIAYYLPVAGKTAATLTLTLKNGVETEPEPVYYTGTTRVTTHYGVHSVVLLTWVSNTSSGVAAVGTATGGWYRADYDSNSNTIPSAYCTTAAGTAAKAASCSGYVLLDNSYIHVIMTTSNTSAGAITMNINGKGAKPIYINGVASSDSNYTLPAGSYLAYYDGTNYYFNTNGELPGHINGSSITGVIPVNHGGTGLGKTSLTANRVIYASSASQMSEAASLYTTGANLAINKTSITSGYNFEVSGASLMGAIVAKADHDFMSHDNEFNFIPALSSNLDVHINYRGRGAHTNGAVVNSYRFHDGASSWAPLYSAHLYPGATNTYNIGSESLKWNLLYANTAHLSAANVGSLDNTGRSTLRQGVEIYGSIATSDQSGGGYHHDHNSIVFHGDSAGVSGLLFTSRTGDTAINAPSDRAFIQYHAHGITTATADNNNPTLATSGEIGRFVIGIGNDANDQLWLQAPSHTGLIHQIGATSYVIPDTGNATGDVGSASQPVYVVDGVIKAATAYSGLFTDLTTPASTTPGNTMSITIGGTTKTASIINSVSTNLTAGTASEAPKLSTTVNTVQSSTITLTKATTGVYGVTKLSSTVSASEEGLAATPKGVNTAVTNAINALDVGSVGVDAAIGNRFISIISQTDGKISAAVATKTIGSNSKPVWINAGTITECSSIFNEVAWDATNKKITKTIGTTASDVVQFVAGNAITLTGAAGKLTIASTDEKVKHTLANTTKFYVTGTTSNTTNTSGDDFDTGVYVTTTAGEISAVRHSYNASGLEKAYTRYNTTTDAIDFIFI